MHRKTQRPFAAILTAAFVVAVAPQAFARVATVEESPAPSPPATLVAAPANPAVPMPAITASASAAAAIPNSVELTELRQRIGDGWIRVTTRAGVFELPEPRLDADGVTSARESAYQPKRVALVQGENVGQPVPPRPIPWESIETLESGRSRWRDGAKAGAFVGLGLLAVGFSIVSAIASTDQDTGALAAMATATVAVPVLLGSAIAAPSKRWTVIHRAGKRPRDI